MNKNQIILGLMLSFSALTFGQVGIGTSEPKATLDVTGKPTDATVVDGVMVPRITGNQLKAKDALYGTAQTGATIYVTAAASPTSAPTIEVTSPGYYVFNGTIWKSASDINIYKDNGTVTPLSNRTVNIPDATNLNFIGQEGGSVYSMVDSGTIGSFAYEDFGRIQLATAGNNGDIQIETRGNDSDILLQSTSGTKNVGIGTQTPTAKLHTNGTLRHQGLTLNNNLTSVLVTDVNGNVSNRETTTLLPSVKAGGDGLDATPSTVTISSINNLPGEEILVSRTFTLTRTSLVTFNLSLQIFDVLRFNGNLLTDGVSKNIGTRLYWHSLPSGSPFIVGNSIIRSTVPFSNSGSIYSSGFFVLNGSRSIVLSPGTYTVNLSGYVYANDNGQGIRASFGGNTDTFDIIAIPLN